MEQQIVAVSSVAKLTTACVNESNILNVLQYLQLEVHTDTTVCTTMIRVTDTKL